MRVSARLVVALAALLAAPRAVAAPPVVDAPAPPVAPADPPPPAAAPLEDEDSVFDAPAPPTLPALTRRDLTFTFEYTAASIETERSSIGAGAAAYAGFSHAELELPLVPRKWFLGAAHDVANAAVPGVGRGLLFGSPELWGRGVWSSVRGLASGGGLGIVIPVPHDLSRGGGEVLRTARVVRPWDASYFNDLTLTFRPWFDMRHITGPFIFQLRQGIDWSVVVRDLAPGERRTDLAVRAAFYFGFRVAQPVGIGLELWEVYQLTADVPDDRRAAFVISPSVRFILPLVQPAISVLVPIATPLRGDVESYYAARLNVGFTFPAGPRADDAPQR